MVFGGVAVMALALAVLGTGMALAEEEPEPGFVAAEDGDEREARCNRGKKGRGGKGMRPLVKAAGQLDLSANQQALLAVMVDADKERRKARRGTRGSGVQGARAFFEDSTLDADAMHASIDDRFDTRRATAHERADDVLAFLGSLDADQRADLKILLEQGRERRVERRQQRGSEGRKGPFGAGVPQIPEGGQTF